MRHTRFFTAALAGLAAIIVAAPAAFAGFDESHTFDTPGLTVRNLIGEVRVESHSESDFRVEVQVRGADAGQDAVEIDVDPRRGVLSVIFPDERSFVYPRLGDSDVNTTLDRDGGDSWLGDLLGLGRRKLRVSGRGSGVEIWADITIRVPRGGELEVLHGVGDIVADDVMADSLKLDSHAGAITATGIRGALFVDTGSGHVTATDVEGDLVVDTGSGHVEVSRVNGRSLNIDTGSGHVRCDDVRARDLVVDTGSGRVTAHGVHADEASIDTGSGHVELELVSMGHGRFEIDTGSGGIDLVLPRDASADIEASTGSGGIRYDLTGDYRVRSDERDEARIVVGGGASRVVLDTGSGGISIKQ